MKGVKEREGTYCTLMYRLIAESILPTKHTVQIMQQGTRS